MVFIINKNINDVYVHLMSDEFLNTLFIKPKIISKDLKSHTIKMILPYKKSILDRYDNEIIHIVKNLCIVNDFILNAEQKIIPFEQRFFVCYKCSLKNIEDFIFFPFLQKLCVIFIVEFCENENDKNMTDYNIVYTDIFHMDDKKSMDINKHINDYMQKTNRLKYDIKKVTYKDVKDFYLNNKNDFFKSVIDINKDIIMQFLNMLVKNCIQYEYIKKVCKYFINNNIDVFEKKYKDLV